MGKDVRLVRPGSPAVLKALAKATCVPRSRSDRKKGRQTSEALRSAPSLVTKPSGIKNVAGNH